MMNDDGIPDGTIDAENIKYKEVPITKNGIPEISPIPPGASHETNEDAPGRRISEEQQHGERIRGQC